MSCMRTCECLVWVCDLSVYILPVSMSVTVGVECTHECVNGMWALQAFACV